MSLHSHFPFQLHAHRSRDRVDPVMDLIIAARAGQDIAGLASAAASASSL
ncbi:hypothetical protein [Modicisalibacter radicis]|nr:hypothetical protein [Halomonas sp. EAR18]